MNTSMNMTLVALLATAWPAWAGANGGMPTEADAAACPKEPAVCPLPFARQPEPASACELRADRIIYDRKTGDIILKGNCSMTRAGRTLLIEGPDAYLRITRSGAMVMEGKSSLVSNRPANPATPRADREESVPAASAPESDKPKPQSK